MAHFSQEKFIDIASTFLKNNYSDFHQKSVLDVGSLDINGNCRKFFGQDYIGVDLVEGPNVDHILDGENLEKLNKKFDIVISCEVFEHAFNWKKIFISMYNSIHSSGGFLIFTCASKGRLEHGTLRTNPNESPGTLSNYYKNLTRKDFENSFDLRKMFKKYIFFYNYYSFDLYFFGIKNLDLKELNYKSFIYSVKNIKSENKKIFFKRIFYSIVLSDKNYHNFRFIRRKFQKFFSKILLLK